MNIKKYLKPFWPQTKTAEQVVHHRRKFGFFHFGSSLQKLGLLHYLIPAVITIGVVGAVATQVPNLHLASFRFTKPKPIVQSTTALPQNIQQAVADLANQQIKQEQANANLAFKTPSSTITQTGFVQNAVLNIQEALTFNPTEKAKLEIKIIDNLIAKLQNEPPDQIEETIQEIGKITGGIVRNPRLQSDRAVLQALIEQYDRLQLILQQKEDTLPITEYLKVEDARQKYLVVTAVDSINNAPNLDAVHNIAVKEIAKVVGDDFADLKAIEVISDFEKGVKPEARAKLSGLERQLAVDFEKKMLKLPKDVRERKLQNFISYSFGNPLRQAQSFEAMKHYLSDREMILAIDSLKELALHRLEDRVFEIQDQHTLNQFLDTNFQTSSDLKILVQLKLDVLAGKDETRKSRIAQLEQNSQAKVIEKFGKAENLAAFLNQDASTSAGLLDIASITQLATSLDSPQVGTDVKNTIKTVRQKTLQNFVNSVGKKDFITQAKAGYNPVSQGSDVRLLLVDPQAISLLDEIKKELPANDQGKITVAQKAAISLLADHVLLHINDPDIFKEHEQSISNNPQIKQLILNQFGQSFFTNLAKKKQVLENISKKDEQKLFEKMQQLVQQIFVVPDGKSTAVEKQLPSEVQAEINKLKTQLPDNNVPKLDTPPGVTLPEVAKLPSGVENAIVSAAKKKIVDENRPKEVELDLNLQARDLGVSDPIILPGNILYPVVELIRNVELVITLDPVAKAEQLISQDNTKTLEAAKLVKQNQDTKTIDLALDTLKEVQSDFDKLKEHADELKTLEQTQPKNVDNLVNQIIDNGLARQTVLSSIQDQVYGDTYVEVEKVRSDILKDGVDTLLQLTNNNVPQLTQKLETAVANSSGSELKDIKAVELLVEISKTQPEEVQKTLDTSINNIAQKLEDKILALPADTRVKKVLDYVAASPSNPVIQFETADELKSHFDNPETIALTEGIKDKAVENLTNLVSEITDGTSKQQFVDTVVGDKPADLKIISDIEARVTPPDTGVALEATPIVKQIEDIKAAVEQNIINDYKDDPTKLVQDLTKEPGHITDVLDVKTVSEIVDVLSQTPEVKPAVVAEAQKIESKTVDNFISSIDTKDATASARALDPIPEVVAQLVNLKAQTPPSVDVKIDAAIKTEVTLIEKHLATEINDPQTFETYVAQIEQDPIVAKVVTQAGGSEFTTAVDKKTEQLQTVANIEHQTLTETVKQIEQEIFTTPVNQPSRVEQSLPPVVQEEIQQIKQEVPVEQIPTVTVSATVEVVPQPTTSPVTPVPTSAPAASAAPVEAPAPAAPEVKPPETQSAPSAPAAPAVGL